MAQDPGKQTREERLAERLRANLRLRKAQARALDAAQADPAQTAADSAPDLSKTPDRR